MLTRISTTTDALYDTIETKTESGHFNKVVLDQKKKERCQTVYKYTVYF